MNGRERLLDDLELAVLLEAERLRGAISKDVTIGMTNVVSRTLAKHGLTVQLESPIRSGKHCRYFDVAGFSVCGLLHTAVEIDIHFNERSARKLEEAINSGAQAFWLRWGVIRPWERARVPSTIRHVELPLEYRSFQDPKVQRRRDAANAAETALGPSPRRVPQWWEEPWNETLGRLGIRRVGRAYEFTP